MEFVEGEASVDDVDAFVAELSAVGDRHGATVQAFDARYVAGERHLRRAVELADRAIERGEAVADDRAVEILLYAAGRRQIHRALEMGVDAGEVPVVVLVDGGDEAAAAADLSALVDPAPTLGARADADRIAAFFDVTPRERRATDASLEDLVVERSALLAVEA